MIEVEVPKLLHLPEKLMPLITELGKYRFYLAEGGRGSGKTNAVARIILYLCDKRKVRVVCGRETQKDIESSVYTILVDLIKEYELDFSITKNEIIHNRTGSNIIFKGFREQGRVNIKGLEGVDILWVDEAEAITKPTLDVIVPTVRKPNSVIFFSMNRFVRNDAVFEFCKERKNALCIHIDYFDNPFCPKELIEEAEECKRLSDKDYRHIWLGEPMEQASDYLFNSAKVERMRVIEPFGDIYVPQSAMGIDFAAQGSDLCVATLLQRVGQAHWKVVLQEAWSEADAMVSTGKIVNLLAEYRPTVACLDVGGMGYVVYSRLQELGIKIQPFNGAVQDGVPPEYANTRAWGYYTLNEYINNEWILMNSPETEKELMNIRFKYRSNGERVIMSKDEMRKEGLHSPDRADSLMMAAFCIKRFLGEKDARMNKTAGSIQRRNVSRF